MTIVMTMVVKMKIVKASEFKAKCLSLMDEVAQSGEEIVVTKNGKPVSKLVPIKIYGLNRGRWQLKDDLLKQMKEQREVENP